MRLARLRFTTLIASLAGALIPAAAASAGFAVHFSNGRQIWSSSNSGASFTNTGVVNSKVGGSASALSNIGIVGLGYHAGSSTYYATASDSWLYKITGLGSANVTITGIQNLGGDTISFDFFGNTFRGVRGNDLIHMNITAPASPTVINSNIGLSSVPATARIGASDFFGTVTNGNVYKINNAGAATLIGNTGQGGYTMAGGSSNDGQRFYATMGYNNTGSNDPVRFGHISTANGAFTLVSVTNVGNAVGQMGMVIVVPLPTAGALAGVGLLPLAMRRRRA